MKVTIGTYRANEQTYALVNGVLQSGRLSYGPLCRTFEQQMATLHSCNYAVLSNSGTSSLLVALQALKELNGWPDDSEVIVPALTFVATVNAVIQAGLKPVLVDVNAFDYSLDTTLVSAAITNKTVCLLPVHPFGQPADMRLILQIAKTYNLKIVEDSCESMFVSTDNKSVGSWGDVGCFSTYVAHLVTTGVGGISTTNDPYLALRMRSLVNHGIDVTELPTSEEYDPTFLARKFRFSSIGHSFRITELEAAIGLPQLVNWSKMIDTRQQNAQYLSHLLHELDHELLQLPYTRQNADHAFMVYPIVMFGQNKQGIMAHLAKHGVEVRDMLPLTNQPCYDFDETLYPVANWINNCGFYVGCHQDLTEAQLKYTADTIKNYFR